MTAPMRKPQRRKTERHLDSSGPAAASIHKAQDAATAAYLKPVGEGARMSEGAIIHVTLRARVLGLRLLRLEATIEAAPAQPVKVQRLQPPVRSSTRPRSEAFSLEGRVIGSRLDEALCFIDEGSASLAAANENRPLPRRRGRILSP